MWWRAEKHFSLLCSSFTSEIKKNKKQTTLKQWTVSEEKNDEECIIKLKWIKNNKHFFLLQSSVTLWAETLASSSIQLFECVLFSSRILLYISPSQQSSTCCWLPSSFFSYEKKSSAWKMKMKTSENKQQRTFCRKEKTSLKQLFFRLNSLSAGKLYRHLRPFNDVILAKRWWDLDDYTKRFFNSKVTDSQSDSMIKSQPHPARLMLMKGMCKHGEV